jgi:hypothetical protein
MITNFFPGEGIPFLWQATEEGRGLFQSRLSLPYCFVGSGMDQERREFLLGRDGRPYTLSNSGRAGEQ